VIVAALVAARAGADPLRLRADALATTSSPAGLLVFDADGGDGRTRSAEAVVWMGNASAAGEDAIADVLVIALHARTLDGRWSGTLGRFVATLGALRPVHVDGAAGRARLPYRFDIEAYAGVPVAPNLARSRAWDWVTGGRVSRRLGDFGSIGVAYMQERDDGRLATEEIGVDAGAALGKRDDIAAKLAYDLVTPGLAEAALVASDRHGALRTDLFVSYRAASHILPATSLFSVLGDTPAERAGIAIAWRAAPRLDVGGELAARSAGGDTAPELVVRAKLRLDDRGASAISGELRRDGVGADEWTGARAAVRIALPRSFAVATELELVIPDRDRGLGAAWPWALVAVSRESARWLAAIAVEASASPQDRRRVDALAQIGWRWGR
jgi:hypothetical protein